MARHQEREERLAAALRENLRKRKAQSRAAPLEENSALDQPAPADDA